MLAIWPVYFDGIGILSLSIDQFENFQRGIAKDRLQKNVCCFSHRLTDITIYDMNC